MLYVHGWFIQFESRMPFQVRTLRMQPSVWNQVFSFWCLPFLDAPSWNHGERKVYFRRFRISQIPGAINWKWQLDNPEFGCYPYIYIYIYLYPYVFSHGCIAFPDTSGLAKPSGKFRSKGWEVNPAIILQSPGGRIYPTWLWLSQFAMVYIDGPNQSK